MLDAKELARRLREAMDKHNPKILSVDLAVRCSVTPQAVNGWRKTGRIAKRHLQTLAEITGQPIEFFLEDERGSSKNTRVAWQRIGVPLAVMAVMCFGLLAAWIPAPAQAAFSLRVASTVHYVKSLLRRIRLSYQEFRSRLSSLASI